MSVQPLLDPWSNLKDMIPLGQIPARAQNESWSHGNQSVGGHKGSRSYADRENKIYFVCAEEAAASVWDIKVQFCHSRWVKEETHKLFLFSGQGHDSCVVLMPTRHLLKPPFDLLICILTSSILDLPEAHSKSWMSRDMSSRIHFWLELWSRVGFTCEGWSRTASLITAGSWI